MPNDWIGLVISRSETTSYGARNIAVKEGGKSSKMISISIYGYIIPISEDLQCSKVNCYLLTVIYHVSTSHLEIQFNSIQFYLYRAISFQGTLKIQSNSTN